MKAGPFGFGVGTWTEDRNDEYDSWGNLFRFEGRNDVGCYVSGHSGVTGTFVAPAASHRRLLEGVVLDGGGLPLDSGAQVKARAESVPVLEGDPVDRWRSIPIHVTVDLNGYDTLSFDVLLDEPSSPRVMKRIVAGSDD